MLAGLKTNFIKIYLVFFFTVFFIFVKTSKWKVIFSKDFNLLKLYISQILFITFLVYLFYILLLFVYNFRIKNNTIQKFLLNYLGDSLKKKFRIITITLVFINILFFIFFLKFNIQLALVGADAIIAFTILFIFAAIVVLGLEWKNYNYLFLFAISLFLLSYFFRYQFYDISRNYFIRAKYSYVPAIILFTTLASLFQIASLVFYIYLNKKAKVIMRKYLLYLFSLLLTGSLIVLYFYLFRILSFKYYQYTTLYLTFFIIALFSIISLLNSVFNKNKSENSYYPKRDVNNKSNSKIKKYLQWNKNIIFSLFIFVLIFAVSTNISFKNNLKLRNYNPLFSKTLAFLNSLSDFDNDAYSSFFGFSDKSAFDNRIFPGSKYIKKNLKKLNIDKEFRFSKSFKDKMIFPKNYLKKFNIIFLSVDALRVERLKSWGYKYNTMPNVEKIISESLVFSNAFSSAAATVNSLIDFSYSKINNTFLNNWSDNLKIDGTNIWYELKKENYFSQCFVCFLPQIFKQATCKYAKVNTVKSHWGKKTRAANKLTKLFIKKVINNKDKKLAYFIHLPEPHSPIRKKKNSPFKDIFNQELYHADQKIGEIISTLKKYHLYDKSIIIIMADHGESISEHSYSGHTLFAYPNVMRVPIIIRIPGVSHKVSNMKVVLPDLSSSILHAVNSNYTVKTSKYFEPLNLFSKKLWETNEYKKKNRILYLRGKKSQGIYWKNNYFLIHRNNKMNLFHFNKIQKNENTDYPNLKYTSSKDIDLYSFMRHSFKDWVDPYYWLKTRRQKNNRKF